MAPGRVTDEMLSHPSELIDALTEHTHVRRHIGSCQSDRVAAQQDVANPARCGSGG
jgi:hypothetical protein